MQDRVHYSPTDTIMADTPSPNCQADWKWVRGRAWCAQGDLKLKTVTIERTAHKNRLYLNCVVVAH